jgi:hypothetical protein
VHHGTTDHQDPGCIGVCKYALQKILVITLFSSFDSRRYLEDEVVRHLAELGTDAVASTSMMNTKTPVTRRENVYGDGGENRR